MKTVITSQKIPIKMWLDAHEIESGALDQAKNLANLPFAFKHIAIMPDSHRGYGMPIGGVMATKDVIIPNAVGSDIGCGMCAVKTSLTELDEVTLKKIMGEIRKAIPVGRNKHKDFQDIKLMPEMTRENWVKDFCNNSSGVCNMQFANAQLQLGTLGGGNHFIEIQKGDDGHIWIMVHSGSRNLGKKVGDHYNAIAKELNKTWKSEIPPSFDLAFLPVDSEEGRNYIKEMNYCEEYALANRKLMMDRICDIFSKTIQEQLGLGKTIHIGKVIKANTPIIINVEFDPIINISHNYASLEHHFGENVWVHRKGATLAREGTIGIIPGSQGTKSYIVRGKGNADSFCSCSHGAGRVMSRSKARAELNLEDEIKILDDLGVVHAIRSISDLDEAPSAYKDIHKVMENQEDLVDILVELTPLAVIKG